MHMGTVTAQCSKTVAIALLARSQVHDHESDTGRQGDRETGRANLLFDQLKVKRLGEACSRVDGKL
jgi:hypothetical protein